MRPRTIIEALANRRQNVKPRLRVRDNDVGSMMQRDIGTDTITFVNVFEVEPDRLDSFLDAWRARAEFMSAQPGFRFLRVLRAVAAGARFQAIVEMEWDSVETLHDATFHDRFYEGARRVVEEFGVVAYPGLYRLAW
jgi:heme oxygenase (mycobilin-producing)